MKHLLSATKIVFIMTALTVCVAFFMGKISEQAFLQLGTMVFSFYYGKTIVDTPPKDNSKQAILE